MNTTDILTDIVTIVIINIVAFVLIPVIYTIYQERKHKHTYRYVYTIMGDKQTGVRHVWQCSRCNKYSLTKQLYPLDAQDFDKL